MRKKVKVSNETEENTIVPDYAALNTQDGWEDSHDEEIDVDLSKVNSRRKFIKNNINIVSGKEYNERLREFYSKRI
jgi:hypothetical protein